ncbi:tyrosine-type recombinase/integrase [Paracoccus sp. S-4012]|uniref:tyrosine-type recombinase/integrase n=1 Tax=Paracoccus sp. S-4012 TaxID=2665648 RepID=UPI0012B02864|nr:tyrosine-type recombinase/integrase [Paracoccus sp. S-4012]MRX50188.1 tyrosine-type recombinase/integrase [Paracoccus sp. S-4012]
MPDTLPLVLPFADWPSADQAAWQALFECGGFLDDDGLGARWAPGTRQKRAQGYGQWVSFLLRRVPDAIKEEPAARIGPDRAKAYLDECQERLAPRSVSNLFTDLLAVARAMAPTRDWAWLDLVTGRLIARSSTISLPAAPAISARKVFGWSLSRMQVIHDSHDGTELARAVEFRRALMIGFLVARPVRRRALGAMRVGHHLVEGNPDFLVRFDAEDMKDGRSRQFPLPRALTEPMGAYLSTYRPILLGGRDHDRLWVTARGQPLSDDGIAGDVETVSARHLGLRLHPHAFRHIAATSIAESDPEHIGIIRDILGHATLDMSERYYNRATGVSSCNMLQSIVEDIRNDMPRIRRAKPNQRTPQARSGRHV